MPATEDLLDHFRPSVRESARSGGTNIDIQEVGVLEKGKLDEESSRETTGSVPGSRYF